MTPLISPRGLLALAALLITQLAGAAGEVIHLRGHVSLSHAGGGLRIPAMGDRVIPGDTLVTGRDSEVHVRMDDAGLIALRPNTRLKVEAYQALGVASDKAELRLYTGRFRSVTGWIGRQFPEHYVIHAGVNEIGARGGCDHEPMQVPDGPGAGTFDRVHCGGSTLTTPYGVAEINAGQVGMGSLQGPDGPDLLPSVPAAYAPARDENLIEQARTELDRQRDELLARRQEESLRKGVDRSGYSKIGDLNDARLARQALEDILRAYEQGNIDWIRQRLDPALIGYQKMLDDMAADSRLCKQMRFHLSDTQVQAGPDVAIVQTRWEKRCVLLPDFKPILITGHTSFLLHRENTGWALVQSGGGNPTPACNQTAGKISCTTDGSPFTSQIERLSQTYAYSPAATGNSGIGGVLAGLVANGTALTSCSAITAAMVPSSQGASIVVTDADRAGATSLPVVISNAQGERETLTLTPSTPGGSQFILAAGQVIVANRTPSQGNGVIEQRPGATCIPWVLTYTDPLTPSGPQDVFIVVGP